MARTSSGGAQETSDAPTASVVPTVAASSVAFFRTRKSAFCYSARQHQLHLVQDLGRRLGTYLHRWSE